MSVKFRVFEELYFRVELYVSFQQITLKLGSVNNFKALFSVLSTDFPEPVHVKS